MIQVKQSNVKFKYNDSGNIKYSPLLDLLVVDHQSEYIDQAKNKIQGIVNQINNNSSVINNFCNGYAPEQNYNVGDYVFYNGELYCCIKTIQNSGETFPENSFKKSTVGDQLLKIRNIQLDRIKRILQCEDSEEIALDPEEDFVPNSYIEASSGDEKSSSNVYYSTNFIDIRDSLKLSYTRGESPSSSPTVGMAFYDSNKIFIPESGQTILPFGNSVTQEQIFVPINACYARFSSYNRSVEKDEFKVIKINKVTDRVNNLFNNLSEMYSSNKSYQVGDYCIKDDKLYQCFTAVEQAQNENWNNIKNNFRQIKIDEELKKLKNFKTKFFNWKLGQYGTSQTESEGVLQRINKGVSRYDYYLGIPCKQGDIFLIKKAKSHGNIRGYVFAKKDTDQYYWTYLANPNWCAPKNTEFTNLILTAPEGAEFLFVTFGISEDNTSWINDDRYATYYINPLAFQIIKILESISALYSEQETYNTDDYCIYDGKLYRCINDEVVNSPQDENNWQETTLISYINSLKNKINNLTANDIVYNSSDSSSLNNTVGNKFSTIDSEIENINTNLNNLTATNNTRLSTLQSNEQNINDNIEDINNDIEDINEDISSLKVNKISIPLNANNGDILVKTSNGLQWSNVLAQMTINADVANAIDNAVGDWLDDHVETSQDTQSTIAITSDLTSTNAAAQAKAAGDLIIIDSTQPSETNNKIWINQSTNVEEVSLSTYEDLTNIVANQYSNKAYKNGEYFINEGILYRVTADIAAADNTNINAVSKIQVNVGEDLSKAVWHEVQNLTTAQQSAARNNIKAADQMTVAFHSTQISDLETRKQDKLTFDSMPTAGSSNPVTSAGIKTVTDALAGDVNDLKSAIDDLSDICTNKTEVDTVYVSGGLNASYGTTTDPTRIRIKGGSMVRLKSGDMIEIGGDFEGKVYASNARGYGSDVIAEVTGGVWTSGTVIIPDLYNNKFFGLLLRSKTNPTSDISELVSSVSQYVKIYTVVERLDETVNALIVNVDSFNSEFYNFTEFAGGLNSGKAWVVSNGVASFDDATGWNAKNALDVNEGEYYRVTACQGQTSNTRTWIVTDNSYNVIEMDSDHYSYDYSKHTSFIRIPSGGTKLLLTYSIKSSVASPKYTWEKAVPKVDLLEEKHESLATRVKLGDLSDADTIRYSIDSTSSYVMANTGAAASLSGYSRTGFVDISEYAYLVYSKLNVPASTTTAGTAFYTDASVDDFISGSGVFCGTRAASPYYEEDIIPVPPTAKYSRFTLRQEVTGVFYVKGIRKNILSGLKLSLLGASIEAFAGAIPDDNDAYYTGSNSGIKSVDEMWWKVLCNNTGMTPLVIDAWSGSSVAYNYATDSTHSDTRKIPMCSDLRTGRLGSNGVNPDIIIVIAGANDWTYSKSTTTPLGDWNGRTAIDRQAVLSGQSTFMESYASMLSVLHTNYPNAIIVCSSLEFTCRGTSNGITRLNNMGYTEADYTNAIERVCKIMGVPFIDIYNVGFTFENYYPTYCIDSEMEATHPNAAGHAVIAKRFIEELPRLVKQFVH